MRPERKVYPQGVIVLGSGPTRDDIKAGEPLAGHMGQEMRDTLHDAGLRRDDLQVLHAYACSPREPKRDKEEKAATLACRPALQDALARLPVTTPLLVAGKWAMLAVNGKSDGLFNSRGFIDTKWVLSDTKGLKT